MKLYSNLDQDVVEIDDFKRYSSNKDTFNSELVDGLELVDSREVPVRAPKFFVPDLPALELIIYKGSA